MAFAATYKDGQRGLLQAALEDLKTLVKEGLKEDAKGDGRSGTDNTACVGIVCFQRAAD